MLEDTNPDAACMYLVRNIYTRNSKKFREGSVTNNIIVGHYRLRRGERWENVPMSSEARATVVSKFITKATWINYCLL